MRRNCPFSLTILIAILASTSTASGAFIPGRLYIGSRLADGAGSSQPPAVFEFDPLTGQSRLFASLPLGFSGSTAGLVFTPDGQHLRVAHASAIIEIDGNGQATVALGAGEGISGPAGSTSINYDAQGNFYVANAANIMMFPASGGAGAVFATAAHGIGFGGSLSVGPNGALFYSRYPSKTLIRFTAPGVPTFFDALPAEVVSTVFDASGELIALSDALYGYPGAAAASRRIVANTGGSRDATLAFDPTTGRLYRQASIGISRIDTATGDLTPLGSISTDDGYIIGFGLAVYVPEPASVWLLIASSVLLLRRRTTRLATPAPSLV